MPWKETCPMDQRLQFIAALRDSDDSFAELCRRFGISRKTGYKWAGRYDELGPAGLVDEPRTSQRHPHATAVTLVAAIVLARKEHPTWGPKKLRAWLAERQPDVTWPAPSTVGDMLKRHGLIRPRRHRARVPPAPGPLDPCLRPNDVWCADFKGHFALGDGTRCHPLTITDGCSRYLVRCEALSSPTGAPVQQRFEQAFREFGLPRKLRTDNGPPFASMSVGGLSALSIWWIKLGIEPERIEPGQPQQNGRHERMHRTLKDEATKPAETTLSEQQCTFDRFRREYNEERPHEALGQIPPARCYDISTRRYPIALRSPGYEDMEVRYVNLDGAIKWRGDIVRVTRLLAGEPVGLRQVDNTRWQAFYGPVALGVLDERDDEPRLAPRRRPRGDGGKVNASDGADGRPEGAEG